jgi:hypothetical protein
MPGNQADELLIGPAIHRRRFQLGEPWAAAGLDQSADSSVGFYLDLDCFHKASGNGLLLLRRKPSSDEFIGMLELPENL